MGAILKDMGITEYDPGVVNQMLEFTYRYVTQILDDARVYANYAKKIKTIEMDDVKLAVHMMMERSFTTPPPRDLLLDVARTRNANPLPAIKANQYGIRLPPDRYCLAACNYRLKPSRKQKISSLPTPLGPGSRLGGMKLGGGGMTLGGSGGGMKQLGGGGGGGMKPTISMVTTKTGNTQTVTLVQKPTPALPSGPTQKIVSVNRPVIKVTPGPQGGGGGTPKIQLSAGNNTNSLSSNVMVNVTSASGIKVEPDLNLLKRKREDDDDSVQ
ncbi:hypothetical protein Pcinc_029703 [Petrolisthes cinctipes]|uniref:Transcription initiation factor TFIID subunit 9 n=1 Tax=Petrolisthes cinctipes TaxID=88211 RepID=A0AAE1EZT3_PETCI|nr:hypothetical protein Pcinc_029703 [Petrolisthes cinctipes]